MSALNNEEELEEEEVEEEEDEEPDDEMDESWGEPDDIVDVWEDDNWEDDVTDWYHLFWGEGNSEGQEGGAKALKSPR
jgi:hypothetical protein